MCLSPPPPPAGPVPIPYPDSSFARDLQEGSSTVKIGGQPLALKGQSYYKSSPLGDEAATRSFGGSVLTHTITGKTYFQAHSMDVVVEGKNVCRHLDITTSNHASYPGSTPPFPNAEAQALAEQAVKKKKCACCGEDQHSDEEPMHRDEWYEDNINADSDRRLEGIAKGVKAAEDNLAAAQGRGAAAIAAASARLAAQQARVTAQAAMRAKHLAAYRELSRKAVAPKTCGCPPVAPSPPCDVYYKRPPQGKARESQHHAIESKWSHFKERQLAKPPEARIRSLRNMGPNDQVNHLTPKGAGGCPVGNGNLVVDKELCSECKKLEDEFTNFQKLG